MAADSEPSVSGRQSSKKEKFQAKRDENSVTRMVGAGIYDSVIEKTCHQCRHKTRDFAAACKNPRKNKPCPIMYCHKCLLNRYGEKAEEVSALGEWSCPKCRGICNCSVCMKRKGCQPTGILRNTPKATGYSSVSEMLLKGGERFNHGNIGAATVASPKKEAVPSPRKRGKENSFHGKLDANLPNHVYKKSKKDKDNRSKDDDISSKKTYQGAELNIENTNDERKDDIQLPLGIELNSVAGIDVCAADVGNALQFLEFCAVFGKILDVKKGQPEYVLQDLLHGRTGRRGKFSVTVQFHIHLLSILQKVHEEKCEELILSNGKILWFNAFKKCLSELQSVPKAQALDSLEKASDYEMLEASEKLRLLNILCDEVLGTEKVRSWMDGQSKEFSEKVKKDRKNLVAANDKEKSLKQKMKDDVAKAITAKHGAPLSISEHEAIASQIKSKVTEAHAGVLEAKSMYLKNKRAPDAIRLEPVLFGRGGNAYWKLNNSGSSDVLHQNVGKGNTLTLDENWSIIDDEGKKVIEKHLLREGKKAKVAR